jgi:hypothetical protein
MYEHVIGACRMRPVTDLLDVREPFSLKSVGRPAPAVVYYAFDLLELNGVDEAGRVTASRCCQDSS